MSEKIPFSGVLNALTNPDANFPARYLKEFSDLSPADLEAFKRVWPRVTLNRKRTLLRDLNDAFREDNLLAFDNLAQTVLDDADPLVRVQAVRLLDENGSIRVLRILIGLGQKDPDVGVRTEAASLLGLYVQMGELEGIPADLKEQVEDILLRDMRAGENPHLQRAALESLGYSGRPEVPELIEKAFERPDIQWTLSALLAISHSADARWQDQVLVGMAHEDAQVRQLAVEAAGELELKAARQPLLTMLDEEEDDDVLEAIIWSLSQIGGEDVRIYLQALLDSADDDDLIAFIEDALANLSFTEDMEDFDLLAFDPDELPSGDDLDDDDSPLE